MMMHVALTDKGPYGKRVRELTAKIQRYLSLSKNRGQVVNPRKIAKACGISYYDHEFRGLSVPIAQIWLQINQDAPLDAKAYYKGRLDRYLLKLDPDVRVVVARTLENAPRQAYCERERAVTITRKITAPFTEEFVNVYQTAQTTGLIATSKLEEAIGRIKDAYITAPIGDTPSITELMIKHQLIDSAGKPVKGAPEGISERAVRERQLAEDWRGQRGSHVVRAFDIIPEEIKLIAIMRAVETHRMLFQHMKALSHIYTTYYRTGSMPALDNKGKQLKLPPNPAIIASMAETMRRMLEGGGEKISITLNNTASAQQAAQGEVAKADVQISQETKDYLARMATMSDAEIEQELSRMDSMRALLANGGVTGEMASGQAIDVEGRPTN